MLTTLSLCVSLLLPATFQEDDPVPTPPTEEEAEAAVEAIESALEREDSEAVVAAVRSATSVPHEDVVEALADVAVNFELRDVSIAAIDALGRVEHEDGVKALTKLHKKQSRRIDDEPEWAVEVYKALGRTGNVDALDVLAKGSMNGVHPSVDKARVLAIGRIRHPDSVEALVDLYNRVRIRDVNKYSEVVRTSFLALTGVDLKGGRKELIEWWNDNKRKVELPEEEPEIEPKKLRVIWQGFWGEREERPDEERG